MKFRYLDHATTHSDGQRRPTVRDARVLRNLNGSLCANCESRQYVLVFRVNEHTQSGLLEARCSRCREPKELTLGEIERECQSALGTHRP
jgi:hypothetical protein